MRTAEYSEGDGGESGQAKWGPFRRGGRSVVQQPQVRQNCPGGNCGNPATMVDDGGYVISQGAPYASSATATVGNPEVVSSSPSTVVGAPSQPAFPTRNEGESSGEYAQRVIDQEMARYNEAEAAASGFRSYSPAEAASMEREAQRRLSNVDAAQARLNDERQYGLSLEAARQSAVATDAEADRTKAEASAIRSTLPTQIMDDRTTLLAEVIEGGQNPEFYVASVMNTPELAGTVTDGKGNAKQGVKAATMTEQQYNDKLARARQEAYGGYAIRMVITNPEFRMTADKGGLANSQFKRQPGETDEAYAARQQADPAYASANKSYIRGAIGAIVGGYSRRPEWKTEPWAAIESTMLSDIRAPLDRYIQKTYLAQRADDIKAGRVTQEQVIDKAVLDTDTIYRMIYDNVQLAWAGSRTGDYNPNLDYRSNLDLNARKQKAQPQSGDEQPQADQQPQPQRRASFSPDWSTVPPRVGGP